MLPKTNYCAIDGDLLLTIDDGRCSNHFAATFRRAIQINVQTYIQTLVWLSCNACLYARHSLVLFAAEIRRGGAALLAMHCCGAEL